MATERGVTGVAVGCRVCVGVGRGVAVLVAVGEGLLVRVGIGKDTVKRGLPEDLSTDRSAVRTLAITVYVAGARLSSRPMYLPG